MFLGSSLRHKQHGTTFGGGGGGGGGGVLGLDTAATAAAIYEDVINGCCNVPHHHTYFQLFKCGPIQWRAFPLIHLPVCVVQRAFVGNCYTILPEGQTSERSCEEGT